MSDTSIGISPECREVTHQGPISDPEAVIPVTGNVPSAGLVDGDVITAVNGKPVKDLDLVRWRQEWAEAVRSGGSLSLTVKRAGVQINLPVPAVQRESVERQLPKIQSFRCENTSGELSDLSFYRKGEDSGFVRVGNDSWMKVVKTANQRFKVGVFDGKAGLKNEETPPVVPVVLQSPPDISPEVPQSLRGPLVGGVRAGLTPLLIPIPFAEAEVGLGFKSPAGYSFRATAQLGASLAWYSGARLSGDFLTDDAGGAWGLFGQYLYIEPYEGSDTNANSFAKGVHLVGGGLEYIHTIDDAGYCNFIMNAGYLHAVYPDQGVGIPFFTSFGVDFIGP